MKLKNQKQQRKPLNYNVLKNRRQAPKQSPAQKILGFFPKAEAVIKGALILAAGYTIGYVRAMRNIEINQEFKESSVEHTNEMKAAATDFFKSMKAIINDAWLDAKVEGHKAAEEVKQDKYNPSDHPDPNNAGPEGEYPS